jgi:signal transduction histidine kinase
VQELLAGRKRLVLGALYILLTLAVLDGALWLFHSRVKHYFDEELGRRLTAIATTISLSLDLQTVSRALDGVATDAELGEVREYFDALSSENLLASVALFDLQEKDLLWAGRPDDRPSVINLDPVAVAKAEAGLAAFSETYSFEDLYFKTGYAPVLDDGGKVIAIVSAEADAGYFSFFRPIERSLLAVSLIGVAAAAVLGVVLIGLARSISRAEEAVFRTNLLATLGRMVAAVAHDIRNPLGIIGGAAQRLKSLRAGRAAAGGRPGVGVEAQATTAGGESAAEGPDKVRTVSEEAELLDFITDEVVRLDSIVKGYLELARPAGGAVRCEVLPLIKRAAGMCANEFSKAGVEIEIDAGERAASLAVKADAAQLQQAFLNVMTNAMEAMPSGGRLSVAVNRTGAEAQIEFRDSGTGISRKDARRMREPFFSTKQSGSGLGLAVVDKVIRDSGGGLRIESERGAGTTVTITLPASEE